MNRVVLRLAIPNILSNLTVPLLGMVDLALMGHLGSELFMGGVVLGGVIFNMLYWGFGFLRMGVCGICAQYNGVGDSVGMVMTLCRGLFVAVVGSLLVLIFMVPIESLSFGFMDGSEGVKALARSYFYVRVFAAPAAVCVMVFCGWFLGMGNSIFPLLVSVVVNVVNVVVSYIMVVRYGMAERGVAFGSVVGQYAGLLLCVVLFLGRYRGLFAFFSFRGLFVLSGFSRFMVVSRDIFIRTLCIIFVFSFFTSKSASFGDLQLAANSVLLQFLFLFSYFIDGFAYAAESVVGRFYGAGDRRSVFGAVRCVFYWGVGFAVFFCLLYLFFGVSLMGFFTDSYSVVDEASRYLLWIVFIPLLGFGSFLWDGVFVGITATRAMRDVMLVCCVFFFFVPFYVLDGVMGEHILWFCMCLFLFSRGFFQFLIFRRVL